MSKDEYTRLENLLTYLAETQETVADNMLKAEKRFAVTEKAIADLLSMIKKRIADD